MEARARAYASADVRTTTASGDELKRQQWLLTVLDASPTASIAVDAGGRVLIANARAQALLAQTAATASMLDVSDILSTVAGHPLDASGVAALASAPPSAPPVVHQLRTGVGRVLRVEVSAAAFDGVEATIYVLGLLDVTRRDESEYQRELLLQMLEQSTDFAGLADLDGRIRWLNAAAQRMLGIDGNDYRGRHVSELVPPSYREWYVDTFLPKLKADGFAEAEMTLENRQTGEQYEVHRAVFAIRDPASGHRIGFGTFTRDISAQKKALRALEAERLRLQLALDAGGMGSWEWDPITNRARWNAREFELAGLTPTPDGTVGAQAFFERIVPEDRAAVETAIADAFTRGEEFTHEFRIGDAARGPRWVAGQARLVPDGSGGVRMIGLNWDVTESHRRVDDLQRANERVRTSVELLNRAERAARVGAFIDRLDSPDGLVWSDTLFDIVGLSREQRPSRDRVFEMYSPAIAAVVRRALLGARESGAPVEIEVPLLPKPGRAEWVHLYFVPHLEAGRCVQVSGAVQDISARKRLELEVVGAANAERERIGADLHDDLGQILTGLSLQLHAHARATRDDAEVSATVEHLERTLQRARDACRRLARAYVAPVSVQGFEEMLLQLAADVPDAIRCLVHPQPLPGNLPVCVAQELYRIAQEAVSNAIRHSKCSTISIDVDVACDRVELCITDDGIGAPPAGRVGGVGLTTMRSRAARIGGLLSMERPEQGGTRVRVTVARLD